MSLDIDFYELRKVSIFSVNITHNLNKMAEAAGIYKALWRPEEIGITKASQLIELLEEGLKKLRSNPELYVKLNPINGWGKYEDLVQFVADVVKAAYEHPDAEVVADR